MHACSHVPGDMKGRVPLTRSVLTCVRSLVRSTLPSSSVFTRTVPKSDTFASTFASSSDSGVAKRGERDLRPLRRPVAVGKGSGRRSLRAQFP